MHATIIDLRGQPVAGGRKKIMTFLPDEGMVLATVDICLLVLDPHPDRKSLLFKPNALVME